MRDYFYFSLTNKRIEEQLECPMRLRSVLRSESEEDNRAFAVTHRNQAGRSRNLVFTYQPPTPQDVSFRILDENFAFFVEKGWSDTEGGAIPEEDERLIGHTVSESMLCVDTSP